MKRMMKKPYVLAVSIILLYIGAYFFGQYVVKPMREPQQVARLEEAPIPEEIKAPMETLPVANLVNGAASQGESCPVSFFLSDLQYLNPQETISMLKACKASTITVPLPWCNLEKEEGNFDPSAYDELLQPYVDAGMSFIFVVDGANRLIINADGEWVGHSVPEWIENKTTCVQQRDFMGIVDEAYGLSYAVEINKDYYLSYVEKVVTYFGQAYKGRVVGFAPGIQSEFEVKYGQVGYRWTDFSNEALTQFRDYLAAKYGSISQLNESLGTSYLDFPYINMPIVTYNNSMMNGALNDDPLFYDFQSYREKAVIDYVIPFYELVHSMGERTISYFGQILCPQDAIYAVGLATELGPYVDTAVIDFNFYNGYDVQLDSMIPVTLVNYLNSAGYDEIWAGIYVERLGDYTEHTAFLQETIDYIAADGIAKGFEIGGMRELFYQRGMDATPDLVYGVTQRESDAKIAIYTSEWNYYKSHGEDVSCYNYFLDSLTQMFKIVRFELGYEVDILCDGAVLAGKLNQYDLVILPAQFYMDTDVRTCIETYIESGGKVIQDFRFGEWNATGESLGSWSDPLFNIGNREAIHKEVPLSAVNPVTVPGAEEVELKICFPLLPNAYSIASADGSNNYLYKDNEGRYYGLYTGNTVVLCFQPQILYKYAATPEERNSYIFIIDSAISLLLK